MLILTRRPLEVIMIGHDVTVTVLGVKGNHVRLGIKAPKSIPVHREEIYNTIAQAKDLNSQPESSTLSLAAATRTPVTG